MKIEPTRTEVIKFKDLSLGLKIAIVLSWIAGTLTIISFLAGFFAGIFSSIQPRYPFFLKNEKNQKTYFKNDIKKSIAIILDKRREMYLLPQN